MKRVIALLICILIMATASISAMAANGPVDFKLTASKTELKPGDEFSVTISLDNPKGKSVAALDLKINFDNGRFTYLSGDGVGDVKNGDFTIIQPDTNKGLITMVYLYATTILPASTKDIFVMKFRVRGNASIGGTKINIADGSISDYDEKNKDVIDLTGALKDAVDFKVLSGNAPITTAGKTDSNGNYVNVQATQSQAILTDSSGNVITSQAAVTNVTDENGAIIETVNPTSKDLKSIEDAKKSIFSTPGFYVSTAVVAAIIIGYVIYRVIKKKKQNI